MYDDIKGEDGEGRGRRTRKRTNRFTFDGEEKKPHAKKNKGNQGSTDGRTSFTTTVQLVNDYHLIKEEDYGRDKEEAKMQQHPNDVKGGHQHDNPGNQLFHRFLSKYMFVKREKIEKVIWNEI